MSTGPSFRLRGELGGKTLALDVPAAGAVLGSSSEADLVVNDATVSRRHAELAPEEGGLRVRDLGSTNGTWVGDRRVESAIVPAGGVVLFGRVRVVVEPVAADDRVVALPLPPPSGIRLALPEEREGGAALGAETTLGVGPLDVVATELLPRLLEQLHAGTSPPELARWLGTAALPLLGLSELEVSDERGGILFQGRSGLPDDGGRTVEQQSGRYVVRATFAQASRARALTPVVNALAMALALADIRYRPLPSRQRPITDAAAPDGAPSLDPGIQEIFRRAVRVAPGDVGVLVLGESGTGKEVLARYVHTVSGRRQWVALNCAALPRDLLEAELFGVEKGTATGVDARPGKIELAHEGTLFLDEIGDMSLETQAKILRVLQEGEVYRLGSSQPRPARARVLSATNKDLGKLIDEGSFRLDLYHRIAGWVVELPPLRERPVDIPGLAVHFLAEEGRKLGRSFRGISQAALDALVAHPWPGNIRQLRQEIARGALFMDDGGVLEASLLSPDVRQARAAAPTTLAGKLEQVERREIERALAVCGGQVAAAAERLGVHRATLYRRINALGIELVEA